MQADVLAQFHPILKTWFCESFAEPTEVQALSWPRIREGESLLITAPTGSGKTLTAFLAAIDALIQSDFPSGQTSILYVSPLKALNNDIQRNLQAPLAELRERFLQANESWHEIRTAVRSGDTPTNERQRMLRNRPEIVITTPESLSLLLTTTRGLNMLSTVQVVILDEIHAVLDSRRGAHLMLSLERLADVAGDFQRIALSATVNPLELVARYVGGLEGSGRPRPVGLVRSTVRKDIDLQVRFPPAAKELAEASESTWPAMIEKFSEHVAANQSTLLFTASRRQAERVTYMLNEHVDEVVAYAHHGSLSREIRAEVETRLKDGQLKAIVATSSLELGIDIGELDEVVLLQSPESSAAAMQRIGRAGHRVGQVSRATLYPMFARDFLDAAVIAHAVADADIEPVTILEEPLDLLAQTLVAMVSERDWQVEDAYCLVCRAWPYRNLSKRLFDLVVEMLTGKYERSRIRDLKPRLALDDSSQVMTIRKGATMALYTSGGTIPDRGYFKLKHADSNVVIGELDEEFVWETQKGKQFAFGSQQWVVTDITHNDVLVRAASAKETIPPFYRSEFINKTFYYSRRVGEFLKFANDALASGQDHLLIAELEKRGFDDYAAEELVRYLAEQRETTQCDLPHANHLVAELLKTGPGGYTSTSQASQLILHTGWGGMVNRPIALCLEAAWEERFATSPDIVVDNHVIAIQMKQDVSVAEILDMLSPDDLLPKMRRSLEKSGFFGARFRECAGRALLLTKRRFDRRMPLWLTRMQAKDLLSSVSVYDDFPILLETWRSCFKDEFDIEATRRVLDDLDAGRIEISECTTEVASPFAATLAHDQLNRYVYASDVPDGGGRASALSEELIAHALRDAALRPPLSQTVIKFVEQKLQRREPGYVPASETEIREWLRERVWIQSEEWFEDTALPSEAVTLQKHGQTWFAHPSSVKLAEEDPLTAIANAIQFYGPRTHADFLKIFPIDPAIVASLLEDLLSTNTLVADVAVESCDELHLCDARNLSTLLRFQRIHNRPQIEAKSARTLPNFIAAWQKFGCESNESSILDVLERMQGYVAPVQFWLSEVWRPRVGSCDIEQLSALCERYGVHWWGSGNRRVTLGVEHETAPEANKDGVFDSLIEAFRDPHGSYTYLQLAQASPLDYESFNDLFWQAVWQGMITSDTVSALAQAELTGYNAQREMHLPSRRSRLRFGRTERVERPVGRWRRLPLVVPSDNEIDQLEDAKERIRVLASRYGVLCRELCNREGRKYRWGQLFRAMRTMELAGELISGLFFNELSGPQFMQPSSLQTFLDFEEEMKPFWLHTYDPASPCGLGLDWSDLPARQQANMLAFCGGELVVVSRSHGKQLQFLVEPEDPRLEAVCRSFQLAVARNQRMTIEKINDESARSSPYVATLSRYMKLHRSVHDLYVDAVIR